MKKSLLAKAEQFKPKVDLAVVETAAELYHDLIRRKGDLEEELKTASKAVEEMAMVTLPDLLDSVGIDHVGVPAKGNHAAFDVVMKPYYRATIAAAWTEERKAAAFAALSSLKAGDLIRRTVTISIPNTNPRAEELAMRFVGMADKVGLESEVAKTVPWNSLTSWVKERVEDGKPLPPLDVIGATVGRKATIKERK